MQNKNSQTEERRKYIRISTVFPVQFRISTADGKRFLSDWLQGFTNNVSKGGICLTINHLSPDLGKLLQDRNLKLMLDIDMPLTRDPISASATVAWVDEAVDDSSRYVLGLKYEDIDAGQRSKIVFYAWFKKLSLPVTLGAVALLAMGVIIGGLINFRLMQGNRLLAQQLTKVARESSIVKQKSSEIAKEKQDLQAKIKAMQARLKAIENQRSKITEENNKAADLNNQIEKLTQEKIALQGKLASLSSKEATAEEDLLRLDKKRVGLEKANIDKMYQWLLTHQNPRTGLIMSFEGDKDIENWAFIYDQALAIIAYARNSDFERANKILDFFAKRAKRVDGRLINAYYVDGSPAEYTVHVGPNVWVGIAALQYTYKTKDMSYLEFAEDIASSIIYLQDSEGGIKGGPGIDWYSTEHNLDAYAFFNMLYEVTSKNKYKDARDKVFDWIIKHTYDKQDIPVKRGKGDSTIATDTYAWSIAAIGPDKLQGLGMDPDRIMEFAEKNCLVECVFIGADGKPINIKGFDFAPQRHLARGGVISSEWTAQMIISFRIMSDFYSGKSMPKEARAYELKADEYLLYLANMMISSPSPSGQGENCLPYATEDSVDTGHGWMTPKGKKTGSLSGTAYTLFAYWNYNPLELK